MTKVGVAGREFHYERAGSGEPLLLIQGMSGTHLSWGEPFKGAMEEDFDVVAFDNRGIGLSAPVDGPFTIAEMAADTAGLLEALGWETAHVVGVSMGGMIAQELALSWTARVRSLSLIATHAGGLRNLLPPPASLWQFARGFLGPRDARARVLERLIFPDDYLASLPDGDV